MKWDITYLPEALDDRMLIIVIVAREDAEAYEDAYKRIQKHDL